ncbi:MAG: sigma-70 family RNA polymerase sigma factor [Eubacteriales bacterium]|nr:sigma-70 family RNA polymerase sigma factor [Eubacteriales bacterium]
MGQKPRVCSSYFFEMEDGSRIEVRRELFLSWLQRRNNDGYKTGEIQEMGKAPQEPGRQQEPQGSEQSRSKLRMFERALGNFSEEEQSLIYYRYYKGMNSKETGLMLGISRVRLERMEKRVKDRLKRLQRNLGVRAVHYQFEHQYYRRH